MAGWTVGGLAGTLLIVMANAICIHTTLESETMRIPELLPFIGKKVQIIVVEDEPATANAMTGQHTAAGPDEAPKRTLGSLRGLLEVPENFDDPLPDALLRTFEGETEP